MKKFKNSKILQMLLRQVLNKGDEINEETAKQKAIEFWGKDNIKEIKSNGLTQNANIECYDFNVKKNNGLDAWISISKIGGGVVHHVYV